MDMFLSGMNHARNMRGHKGCHSFTEGQLEKYERRHDAVIAAGREQNKGQGDFELKKAGRCTAIS